MTLLAILFPLTSACCQLAAASCQLSFPQALCLPTFHVFKFRNPKSPSSMPHAPCGHNIRHFRHFRTF